MCKLIIKNHKKDKAVIGGRVKFVVLFRNWIHQGFFYLDRTEKFYRVIWELIPAMLMVWLLYSIGVIWWLNVILSLFIAHTLNWIFNDNFWTCIQFTLPNKLNPGNDKTKVYLEGMQNRMQKRASVGGCMIYGSMSRGVWKEKSDLDVRILRKSGIMNGFLGYWACWTERLIAVFAKQPLDIYMADSPEFLKKMRVDEYPIFIKADDCRLNNLYEEIRVADFKEITSLNELSKNNLE